MTYKDASPSAAGLRNAEVFEPRHELQTDVKRGMVLLPSKRSMFMFVLLLCLIAVGFALPMAYADNTYSVSVLISGLPSTLTTRVYVDGAINTTLAGGQTGTFVLNIATNPHVITVDFYVPSSAGSNGTRYFVQDASWGFSTPGNHIFAYSPQYYLTVETPYSSATGQGWYDSGTAVTVTIKDQEIDEGQGTRHVFAGWSQGASGTGATSNSIYMTAPLKAVANWKTQFYLTVESDPPNVTNLSGAGWYDAGTQATFSAPLVVQAGGGTQIRFDHWAGDYTAQSPTGTILMDRPKAVKASYYAQYLLTVQYDPASITSGYNETRAGWYDADSNVQLGPAPSTIGLSSVERLRFAGWVSNGVTSTNPSFTVVMDQARTVTLKFTTQYYVDVRSSQGSVTGSGWYDSGSTAKLNAYGSQTWPFLFTLTGWRLDPSTGTIAKTDDSWNLTVDKPYVVEAQWSIDYFPLFMIFGGGGLVAAAVVVGIVVLYRRGRFNRAGAASRPRVPRRATTLTPPLELCSNCGNPVPKGAEFCQKCGASVGVTAVPSLDDKVYDYIVKHEGVISLSTASADLGIPVEELKEITDRLKKQGRLA